MFVYHMKILKSVLPTSNSSKSQNPVEATAGGWSLAASMRAQVRPRLLLLRWGEGWGRDEGTLVGFEKLFVPATRKFLTRWLEFTKEKKGKRGAG